MKFRKVGVGFLAVLLTVGVNAAESTNDVIRQFKYPPGFKMNQFAGDPLMANPVALEIDEQGRVFVAETFRLRSSTYDIRHHRNMFDDDLACRTVEDRLAMCKKFLGAKIGNMAVDSELVRLLEDTNGDGVADKSTVFADGFNGVLDGVAAGVLARRGKIYFANIPNLWMLQDTNRDGRADVRASMSYGYGVRFGLTGHDLHGLRFGPDGKLYFSMGDRGLHVKTHEGRVLDYPDTGTVLRCNPDGSDLEVFAFGVRNPQELAFDDYGNLFSGDNNCDHGDRARLIYIVEGGDTGWRVGNQFSETTPAGVWNSEKLWHTQFPGQAAYILPPVAHLGDGPSGFTHYPGTGFGDNYKDHFFLCDFRGAPLNSGIHSFAVEPDGATFKMVGRTNFLWNILATDAEFGPDGCMYVTDWIEGWVMQGKGRLFRLQDEQAANSPLVQETKRLIAEGMTKRAPDELIGLLAHADQRVRQDAQFELAERGKSISGKLETVARQHPNRLARLHAIWSLGQIRRTTGLNLKALIPLLKDKDAEVRAQTAKVFGDSRFSDGAGDLIKCLRDANARVKFFAAVSLGKLGNKKAIAPLLEVLRENADEDVYLRHAAVMGLVGAASKAELVKAAKDKSDSVRMGVLLAMRRLRLLEVATFLKDANPLLVIEAARAINDTGMDEALPQLAALIEKPSNSEMMDWRVINANFHRGTAESAKALATYAAQSRASAKVRSEALHALMSWAHPVQRDRITGNWRATPARDEKVAAAALRPVINQILSSGPEAVRSSAVAAVQKLGLKEAGPALFRLVEDAKAPGALRTDALQALAKLRDARAAEAIQLALADRDDAVRKAATALQAESQPGNVAPLARALEKGTLREKQGAFATLGTLPGKAADELIVKWMDELLGRRVPMELQFDLLEAAGRRDAPDVKAKLGKYQRNQPKGDDLAGFRETLFGGDAKAGEKIFREHAAAACVRCHKIKNEGGQVGPELAGIITRHDRQYILESVLLPNKQITTGFESVNVKMGGGESYFGIVRRENGKTLILNDIEENKEVTLDKADIKSRVKGLSAMPEGMSGMLTKRELRDLVEFLVTLK